MSLDSQVTTFCQQKSLRAMSGDTFSKFVLNPVSLCLMCLRYSLSYSSADSANTCGTGLWHCLKHAFSVWFLARALSASQHCNDSHILLAVPLLLPQITKSHDHLPIGPGYSTAIEMAGSQCGFRLGPGKGLGAKSASIPSIRKHQLSLPHLVGECFSSLAKIHQETE